MRRVYGALIVGLSLALTSHLLIRSSKKTRRKNRKRNGRVARRLNAEKSVPLPQAQSVHFSITLVAPEVGNSTAVIAPGTQSDAKRPHRWTRSKT